MGSDNNDLTAKAEHIEDRLEHVMSELIAKADAFKAVFQVDMGHFLDDLSNEIYSIRQELINAVREHNDRD